MQTTNNRKKLAKHRSQIDTYITYSELCFAVPVEFCFYILLCQTYLSVFMPAFPLYAIVHGTTNPLFSKITIGFLDDEVPTTIQKVAVYILRAHTQFAATGTLLQYTVLTLLQYIAEYCKSWWSCSFRSPVVSWLSAPWTHWVFSSGYSLSFIALYVEKYMLYNIWYMRGIH